MAILKPQFLQVCKWLKSREFEHQCRFSDALLSNLPKPRIRQTWIISPISKEKIDLYVRIIICFLLSVSGGSYKQLRFMAELELASYCVETPVCLICEISEMTHLGLYFSRQ